MQLTVQGAAGEVTGSCHLIEAAGKRVLLDCGMFQGGRDAQRRNAEPFPFEPSSIDAVVLSHAHIDHSGRLPLLVKQGFRGRIYAHRATADLCRVMLKDAAFILERGAEWENKKRARKHLAPVSPLYDQHDAVRAMRAFRGVDFETAFEPATGLRAVLHPAGHILGASIVELADAGGRRLIFSGDLGSSDAPLLAGPWQGGACDLLVVESTYGNRRHRSLAATWREIGEIIAKADADRGNIIIPAFAVGRTQQILHAFRQHFDEWGMARWRIFLDSPLAAAASEIHDRHAALLRPEAQHARGFLGLPNVHVMKTANQSININRVKSSAIIIAGSGMCEGGRVKHHLKHNLWRDNCHVMIVGFQAGGTLGRRLVDGAKRVSIFGEAIHVGASIHTVGGLSAHADQKELVDWVASVGGDPRIVVVHGEAEAEAGLVAALAARGIAGAAPARLGDSYPV